MALCPVIKGKKGFFGRLAIALPMGGAEQLHHLFSFTLLLLLLCLLKDFYLNPRIYFLLLLPFRFLFPHPTGGKKGASEQRCSA